MSLIVNPSVQLHFIVHCRVRGRGPLQIALPIGADLGADVSRCIFELLATGAGRAVPESLPESVVEELANAGLFVSSAEAVAPLPSFACSLGSVLPELWPARVPSPAALEPASLAVAPGVVIERDAADETALSHRVPGSEVLGSKRPLLWVRDPGPGTWMPFQVEPSIRAGVLSWLERGGSAADLPSEVVKVLRAAGVLVPSRGEPERAVFWKAQLAAAQQQLATEDFAVVRGFIQPAQLAGIRRYLLALEQAAAFSPGDDQVELRDCLYDDDLARFLHHQLLPTVNQLVPVEVKPSYTYLVKYHPGAILRRHTDRPQCQWNVSLVLDTNPETDLDRAWPIWVESHGQQRAVRLGIGDLVLYRGTEVPHWRDALPAGQTCTVCLCHYVSSDFTGSLK